MNLTVIVQHLREQLSSKLTRVWQHSDSCMHIVFLLELPRHWGAARVPAAL